ncbi:ribokinase [Rhodocytophaga aerolata]|uniref:Ribokinase n=1 Tax=Rhodocytophaga aerolata TaxID=455078 RepID=A0ABT8R6S8_9BACT|nr:ribokinase [Rhodocytophaga aerolata]MDO1446908.1 ribokinase [Rhodocytophaga aerolata]
MPGKIMVIGSSNTDMVIKAQKLPSPGETILGGEFHLFPGGKGANQAVAAARLGGEVFFVARTGNDVFGKQAIEQFTKEGIHTRYIHTDPDHPSGVALIMVDEAGENIIAVAPGANAQLKQEDIDEAMREMETVDIVLLQLEIPLSTVHYAIKKLGELGKKVVLNPAPAQALPEELFKHLYLITPNETEAEILTGIRVTEEETAAKAATALREKGVKQVVITLGPRGAFVLTDSCNKLIAAPKVQAIDTTAAGDIFNGALVVAIAQGQSLEDAVNFACRAAAISVTRLGAQASAPYLQELKQV